MSDYCKCRDPIASFWPAAAVSWAVCWRARWPPKGTKSLLPAPRKTAAGQMWHWDARKLGALAAGIGRAAAVINLTGRSVNCRYNEANRRLILESRVLSTRVLGEAIAACAKPPPTWLNASTATIYKHSFDRDDG